MNPIAFIFAYLFVNSLQRFQEMPWLLKCRPGLRGSDFRAVGSEEIQLITGHSISKTTVSYVSMSANVLYEFETRDSRQEYLQNFPINLAN